jgi:signal transduction histidine kinase/ActR/RegA family two-component response regulator
MLLAFVFAFMFIGVVSAVNVKVYDDNAYSYITSNSNITLNTYNQTWLDFNGKNSELEKFQSDDLKVIDDGQELFVAEETVTDSNGMERLLQTIKRPLFDTASGQMQVLGVCTDITQLKTLHQQLVQSQKMEAIGQLAGGIAHDFNNLLTGVLGYADMLQAVSSEPNEVRSAADMISGAARRASELTEKLLGFARKGKNQNIPVDVHAIIREALTLIERTVQKDILLVEQLNADRAYVSGDPVQIEQVILNLVINARDAITMTNERSGYDRITIATKLVKIEKEFEVADLPIGEYLEMSVTDSGCGIADELKDRIFEPFFTTKESGKGTGMGLAMVYGIIKNHEGTVMVESQLGVGTTLRILLPICQHVIEVTRAKGLGTVQTGEGSILIVDDHPVIREVTKEMMILLGYQVTTVADGPEAIEILLRNKNCYDLVILDMVMPKMNARDCIKSLKEIEPSIKIILSTGYGKNELVQELLGYGLVGFIQKPYQLAKLSQVVAEALQSPDCFESVKADNIEHA